MAHRRRVIANITLTLDGHTTGPGGPYDMSCIAPHGMTDEGRDRLVNLTRAPTVLLGRTNFEGFGAYWPRVAADNGAEPRDQQFAQWLDEVEKVVFSNTLTELGWRNARLAQPDPAAVVRELRSHGEGDIRVLSSQSLIRQLLAAGEVDRLEVTLAPHIAGGGDRLFDDSTGPSDWHLAECTQSSSGATHLILDLVEQSEEKR